MSVLKIKEIHSSLQLKGFEVQSDRKHIFYYLCVNGKRTSIRTHISHGEDEVDDSLISFMKKQTKLSKAKFIDLIKCPLSKEAYINILLEQGDIF